AIEGSLNQMLEQIEDLFEKERAFFADAAHTLKTPLAVIHSEIEASNLRSAVKRKLLDTISAVSDTIQDLIYLSKIGAHEERLAEVSLTEIMQDLTELAKSLGQEKSLQVTADIKK